MFLNLLYMTFSGGNYKEDKEFVKERDAKRVQFDKKTGKAVTVTGPRDKPESVKILLLIAEFNIGFLRSC